MADQEESSPKEDPSGTERTPFIPGTESMVYTSDDVIEDISRNRTWKFNVYLIWMMLIAIHLAPIVYLTPFAGNPCTEICSKI